MNTTTTATAATASLSTVPARPSSQAVPYATVTSDPVGEDVPSYFDPTTTTSSLHSSTPWPHATITSPSDGQAFTAYTQDASGQWYFNVTLEGEAHDPRDPRPYSDHASLEWRDSVNGGPSQVIGTGRTLTVLLAAPNFSNTHHITLTVSEIGASASTATDEITINVNLLY